MVNLDSQLADSQDMLQEETRQKLAVQSKLRLAEDKLEGLADQLEEEEDAKHNLESKCSTLSAQIVDLKKRLDDDTGLVESYEENKKKMQRDIENVQGQFDAVQADNDKLHKSKKKLQAEVILAALSLLISRYCPKCLQKLALFPRPKYVRVRGAAEKYLTFCGICNLYLVILFVRLRT